MKKRVVVTLVVLFALAFASLNAADSIWDLQAVNPDGTGSHPEVGADYSNPANKVSLEGIALNSPAEILDTSEMWQVYVQGEAPDKGGIAAWAGIFYNPNWPRYPEDIQPGDRIRIEGFVEDHNGKVNINERHSADPLLQFTVTKLQAGVGMPDPIVINDLADCNYFDQTRSGGGELYQAQWVRINNVHIQSGDWGAGNSLTIADDYGSTLTMLLSSQGDFDGETPPPGNFSVLGIFDQEDLSLPYHEVYRIWVKHYSDIILPTAAKFWERYE